MKILITYPPLSNFNKVPLLSQNRQFQWFSNPTFLYPLVPASAATLLSANGFNVIWKDAIAEQITYDQFLEFFQDQNPDLVVLETKTPVIKKHWQIIWDLKQIFPETKFALMGDHVTALPEESLRECPRLDFVITGGDYDFSLLALARYLKGEGELPTGVYYRKGGNIVSTGQLRLDNDLDSLPLIDRDLTKFQLYNEANIKRRPFAYTMAGRDCPYHKCRFCSWTTLYPNFRVRSPENYIKEIGLLVERYGVREIFDDTGTFPSGDWMDRFCQLMIEQGYHKKLLFSCNLRFDCLQDQKRAELMKKAGFRLVKSGLESANQLTLDRINKGLKVEDIINGCRVAHNAGLDVHLTMMVGFPWEKREEARNTLSLARYLMSEGLAEVLQSTVVIPYPGTPLHQEAVQNGWFRIEPQDYERYDMTEPVLTAGTMTSEEVMQICDEIYKVYLSPGYIWHRLTKLRSWDDIKYHARGVRAVLKHIRDFARGKVKTA
ncbi:MAG: radical SAM protein [Dehalococcoidia bacterium]|nr:radical SAM protein [Dehalococcoidia bacterium]